MRRFLPRRISTAPSVSLTERGTRAAQEGARLRAAKADGFVLAQARLPSVRDLRPLPFGCAFLAGVES